MAFGRRLVPEDSPVCVPLKGPAPTCRFAFAAALHLRPKVAWSLYCRGLARLHKGLTAAGQEDIAAAAALQPKIAADAAAQGITPP